MLGRLSDHTGRKPCFLVSQVGTLFGFILLALANSLWLIFLSRIMDGLTAGNISLAQAYIADVTKPEERTKSFAVIGIAFGVGFLIGPAISGYLAQFSYPLSDICRHGAVRNEYCGHRCSAPAHKPLPRRGRAAAQCSRLGHLRGILPPPGLSRLTVAVLRLHVLFFAVHVGISAVCGARFTWDGHAFGPKEVGYMYAYVGVLGCILQGGLIGRLSKAFGDWKLVRSGLASVVVAFVALAWTFGITKSADRHGIHRVRNRRCASRDDQSDHADETDKWEQGSVLGLTQSLQSVAQITAPFLAGLLIEHGQLHLWAIAAAVSAGLGADARSSKQTPRQ